MRKSTMPEQIAVADPKAKSKYVDVGQHRATCSEQADLGPA